MKKSLFFAVLWLLAITCCSFAESQNVLDLSNLKWKLSLDKEAIWQNDILYAPPVDIRLLKFQLPTGGWEALNTLPGKTVNLPATVEQYYWGENNNSFGVDGNYVGVSWFNIEVVVPQTMKGKHIFLNMESVRFRAEIFVNQQPVGYDLVNGTPFQVDITDAVIPGALNKIAIRITDPNGNFNWKDSQNFMWGNYRTIPSHGFGGITGKIFLTAKNNISITDVFVKNKPMPHEVDVEVTTQNAAGINNAGSFMLEVKEHAAGHKMVYSKKYPVITIVPGENVARFTIDLKDARLWSIESPNLYDLSVRWANDKEEDYFSRRFGFRWFEVNEVNGNKQFTLNGKRIVLRTAISWGFWPDNGITPDDSLAKKQIVIAKKLGLNMLNFHRSIGQTNVLDCADELGLLYFEEPGGNQYPANKFNAGDSTGKMQADFYLKVRKEKLLRMIRRDRNHPSLVIYNLHNERGADPQDPDRDEMQAAHKLDETRIITYNSCNGNNPQDKPNAHFKLHLLPYDRNFHDTGWWDEHHAGGPGVYHDFLYKNANEYHRGSTNTKEIVYWGEEGAIGTPPRLELIRNEILKSGKTSGWEAADYLKWYDAYASFIKEQGFTKAFPTVDSLTRAMGDVSFYYQGRVIENIRINNVVDGYAVNGWESMKLENHSGIVDNYRNPKGDVNLIARYNRPLYIAVKLNRKVLSVGSTTVADFHIVNEVNLNGNYLLKVTVTDSDGKTTLTHTQHVKVAGGNHYGELLQSGWEVPVTTTGYSTVKADLIKGGKIVASGDDKIFAVKMDYLSLKAKGMVADSSGTLQRFLSAKGCLVNNYKSGAPEGDYLLVGAFEPQQSGSGVSDIMEWVYSGHTLIIVNNAEHWADFLAEKETVDYRGSKKLGTSWFGGNYFVKDHPLFEGLPVNCVFNWEYQCFATYNRKRTGLRIFNGETIVGCVSDHKKEVYSALSVIPAGRGNIILCALDMFSCIQDVNPAKKIVDIDGENASMSTFNTKENNQTNVVGQRLLFNMLNWTRK